MTYALIKTRRIHPQENPIAVSFSSDSEQDSSARAACLLTEILRGWMVSGPSDALGEKEDAFHAILPLAIATKTVGLLGGAFDRMGVAPSGVIAAELSQRQTQILAINMRAFSTIAKLAQTFDEQRLRYVVIKGPLRAEQVYGAMDVRFGSDIDVFVERSDYRQAARILEERMGYSCLVPEDDRWWHDYLGEAPFAANEPGLTLIDLHNQLQQPGGPYPTDLPSFLETADRRPIGRTSARILSSENALMLTAISFGKARRNDEPWIAYAHELAYALHTMPAESERDLKAHARQIGIGRLFDEFLRTSKALFASSIATDAHRRLALSACGLAPSELLSRSKASWRWTEGAGLARLGRFFTAIAREAKGRLAYRTSTRFD